LALGDFGSEQEALDRYDELRSAGFAVRIAPRAAEGGWRYAVRLSGFANAHEARAAAGRLKSVTGVEATVLSAR
jgi:hypothetical protein